MTPSPNRGTINRTRRPISTIVCRDSLVGTPRRWLRNLLPMCVLLIGAAGCASSPTSPTPTVPPKATISDPSGDALADARIAISPDLLRANAEVSGGSISFVITFAPGTLDRSTTWIRVDLDIDENSATGWPESAARALGVEYNLLMLANGNMAAVQKSEPEACRTGGICASHAGFAPMIVAADTIQVTVPLSLLAGTAGADDGHMRFVVKSWAVVNTESLIGWDQMPNEGLPAGRI